MVAARSLAAKAKVRSMTYLSSVESRAHVTHASTDKITKYYRTFLSVVAAICKILPCYLVRASRVSAIPRVHDARSDGVRPLVISCSSQNPSPLWSARRNPLFSLGLERERCGYRPRPLIFAYNGTTCVAWTCKLRRCVYCIGIGIMLLSISWGVPLIFNVKAMAASLWRGLIGRSRPIRTAPAGRVHR